MELLTDLVLRTELDKLEGEPEQQVREKIEAEVFRRYTEALSVGDANEQCRVAEAAKYEAKLTEKERAIEAIEDARSAEEAAQARIDTAASEARGAAIAEVSRAATTEIEKAKKRNRILTAALVAIVSAVIIGIVPWATDLEWLEKHDNRVGLYLTAIAVSGCYCWAIIDLNRREKLRWSGVVAFLAVLMQIV